MTFVIVVSSLGGAFGSLVALSDKRAYGWRRCAIEWFGGACAAIAIGALAAAGV